MKRTYIGLVGCLASLALVSCKSEGEAPAAAPSSPATDEAPSFGTAITLRPRFDASANVVIMTAQLRPGFHVYTTGETIGRPIRLELEKDGDWKANGEPEYPAGITKTTALGTSVVVEGTAECRLPVKAAVEMPGSLHGEFHYQVCTDSACDRPRKLAFEIDPINSP